MLQKFLQIQITTACKLEGEQQTFTKRVRSTWPARRNGELVWITLEKRRLKGNPTVTYNRLEGCCCHMGDVTMTRGDTPSLIWEIKARHEGKTSFFFFWLGGWYNTWAGLQRSSILPQGIQDLERQNHGWPDPEWEVVLHWVGGWTRLSLEVPSNQHFHDSLNMAVKD